MAGEKRGYCWPGIDTKWYQLQRASMATRKKRRREIYMRACVSDQGSNSIVTPFLFDLHFVKQFVMANGSRIVGCIPSAEPPHSHERLSLASRRNFPRPYRRPSDPYAAARYSRTSRCSIPQAAVRHPESIAPLPTLPEPRLAHRGSTAQQLGLRILRRVIQIPYPLTVIPSSSATTRATSSSCASLPSFTHPGSAHPTLPTSPSAIHSLQ